jgi:hypothetical protein
VTAGHVLDGLIDHAPLFPPASMDLPAALAEDREARASAHAGLLGRFVVPAGRLADLPPGRAPLSVVLAGAEDARLVARAHGVEAVETRLPAPRPESGDLLRLHSALRPLAGEVYYELVLDRSWRDSLPAAIGAVAAIGARVKLRCGGEVVPSIEQVAFVIACCREARVPFKATAGLHHAARRGEEHGFLNLLAATGAPKDRIEAVLAEEDAGALELDGSDRRLFVSFGSCSWREPVDDLAELGLLA